MSPSSIVNLQRQMGKHFDANVILWKKDAEKKLSVLRFLEDLSCNQLACEDDDMDLDKEINLDIEAVKKNKYFNEEVHQHSVEIMNKTMSQLGESRHTDELLSSAIKKLHNDDIPYFK